MVTPLLILFIIFLALLSFLFSASETSIIGLSKIRLRHLVEKKIKGARRVEDLVKKLDKLLAAILIGNTLVNIAISAIVTGICVEILGYKWGVILSTFATTFTVLVFCEITPKLLATKLTEKTAFLAAPIMEVFIWLFHPFIVFFIGISNFLLKIFRIGPLKRSPLLSEEELRTMIEIGKDEGVLSEEERKMLHRIFEFGDTKVGEVMVPKEKMAGVNVNFSYDDLLNAFAEEGHARLPVYSGSIDNILGIIYARDLLYILRDKGLFLLQDLLHPPYFVPASMRVNELLAKFQSQRIQIAIVVDEKKKTLGLVTLEDLIEEIVGEIDSECTNHICK